MDSSWEATWGGFVQTHQEGLCSLDNEGSWLTKVPLELGLATWDTVGLGLYLSVLLYYHDCHGQCDSPPLGESSWGRWEEGWKLVGKLSLCCQRGEGEVELHCHLSLVPSCSSSELGKTWCCCMVKPLF